MKRYFKTLSKVELRRPRRPMFGRLVFGGLFALPLLLRAQALPVSLEYEPYPLDSGTHGNSSQEETVPFTKVITASTEAPIIRVHFSAFNLGAKSCVTLTSLKDQGRQRLDAQSLPQWQNTSALFNGGKVQLELHVAPGEKGVFVRVDQLVKDCHCSVNSSQASLLDLPESLCGADSRVASTDFRVGRISGCTAWLVSNGAVLTAGHCAPLGGVFEVNVPASQANGTPVAADPDDQYPIDTTTVTSVNNGQGDDWTVFRLLPNSNTGQRAHIQHGFFRMSRETPALGATIRVTGHGVDNTPASAGGICCARDNGGNCTHPSCNSTSRTLQTATGPFQGEFLGGANNARHTYQADTEPANSGSPIIWSINGFAIGIHTNGGCQSDGTGSNSGTSFENNGLETALQNFPGANTRYVDVVAYPNSPTENGTIFQPFSTFPAAVTSVPSGGRVSLVEGSYTRAGGNIGTFGADGKSFSILAPVGTVTIGN